MSGIFRRKIYIRRPGPGGQINWDPITVPIVCMSTLYQRCSGNTIDVPILIASSTDSSYPNGYPTASSGNGPIQQFVYDINKAILNGSPETWLNNSNILKLNKTGFKFYVNSVAEADGTTVGIMEAFDVNREPTDENMDMYIQNQETPDNRYRIGYSYFAPNPGAIRSAQNIRGSLGISGAGQIATEYQHMPSFAYSRLYVPSTEAAGATDKHSDFTMLIWPDKVASGVDSYATGGKWDFTKLDMAMGGTRRMVCELRIEMWQHSNEATDEQGTWFWNVYVVPHELTQQQTDFLNTYLQGEETGPKYNLGDETPDDGDEPPGIPATPPDLIAAGGYNAYKISLATLPTIFNFLNAYTPLDSLVKMWSKPAEGIISLHMLPFDAHISGNRVLSFHGVPIVYPVDSGQTISAPTVEQWQEWNMGSVILKKPEDYIGYSPYTQVSIFLPFIGVRPLDADEVIGTRVKLDYRIDVVTGAVTAWVSINGAVRYTFTGSCACSMPLSGTDWSGVYSALGAAALSAVSGGLSAAHALTGAGKAFAGGIVAGVGKGLEGAMNAADKPIYQKITTIGNTSALNSVKEPYIIVETADSAKPDSYKTILGNPASRSVSMGSLSGFNVIQECHIDGSTATAGELNEIESLLKGGVIF